MKNKLLAVLRLFDRRDIPVIIMTVGIVFVGLGAAGLGEAWRAPGLGKLVAGLLIILYARPLKSWWGK